MLLRGNPGGVCTQGEATMPTRDLVNFSDIFDRYWNDDLFRHKFLQDPSAVLRKSQLMNVDGMEMEVVDHKENMIHLIFHSDSPDMIHLVSHRHPRLSDRG